MNANKKYLIVAAMVLVGLSRLALGWGVEVEGSSSMKGVSQKEARDYARKLAKKKAVDDYISSRLPPAVQKDRAKDIEKIAKDTGRWIASWEEVGERQEGDRLFLSLKVELARDKLDSALKTAGILPSRPLPRVFVVVPGTMGEDKIASAWDKAPGQKGTRNACEDAIVHELYKYGFPVIKADDESPSVDTGKITGPEGEEERGAIFKKLDQDFGAQILVVGTIALTQTKGGGKSADTLEISLKIAAADVAKARVVWSDKAEATRSIKGLMERERALEGVCADIGAKAMESLFAYWNPRYLPGEEREILLVVQGVKSYAIMKELEKKLEEEAPGVKSATISRMGPLELEFKVITDSDAVAIGDWLTGSVFGGMRLEVEELEETKITATARN